jgi:hypothetical protein
MAVRRLVGAALAPTRTLVLELGEPDLRALIQCNSRVALAKASGSAPLNAIWLAWAPAAVTTVVWTETYGLYAGAIPQRSGASIRVVASVQPAAERASYAFLGHAFAPPVVAADLPRRHYEIRNVSRSPAAFGLLQAATIDGVLVTAPLNAVVLPPDVGADFAHFDTVYLWLQAGVFGATVAAHISQATTTIVYAAGERVKRYRYDARTSLFLPLALPPEDRT